VIGEGGWVWYRVLPSGCCVVAKTSDIFNYVAFEMMSKYI